MKETHLLLIVNTSTLPPPFLCIYLYLYMQKLSFCFVHRLFDIFNVKWTHFQIPQIEGVLCQHRAIKLKIYSHKMKNVMSVMFTSLLIETQHLCIIWKIEAVFKLFLSLHISCTILLSCGIAHPCIQ